MEIVLVREETDIAEARRTTRKLAQEQGLDVNDTERAAILVTEAASNLLKHAGKGKILIGRVNAGLDFLFLDKGPGIENPSLAMQDGYSTAGSKGNGLGAISRLATEFDIYSQPGKGTAIYACLTTASMKSNSIRVISIPKQGEMANGDGWAVNERESATLLMVVDGLGHGPDAQEAAQEAITVFRASQEINPGILINRIHLALKKTRGAAAAIASVNQAQRQVVFAGIGNIHAVLASSSGSQMMVSISGTLGHQMRHPQEFSYQYADEQPTLIMHSDGLTSRWHLTDYAGLLYKPLPLLAGVLYRDFNRDYDDTTILAAHL